MNAKTAKKLRRYILSTGLTDPETEYRADGTTGTVRTADRCYRGAYQSLKRKLKRNSASGRSDHETA
jgi:hypothetical protein